MTIKQQTKRDEFEFDNSEALNWHYHREVNPLVLKDDFDLYYREWIGNQTLEDLKDILKNYENNN